MAAKKKSAALRKQPAQQSIASPISEAIYGADGGPKDAVERLRLMEMLVDVAQRVARLKTLDEVLSTLVAIITEETNADRSTLFLHDEATNELYSRIAGGNISLEVSCRTNGSSSHVSANRQCSLSMVRFRSNPAS